ncbi:hypothetical protein Francci3_1194 [Frankia casuarinae]|uniref:Uncharacterized protein n=1 Tax=Frankia casuarinae (strain DSM 45818 / CECT 9043 / HFP020203 / CcI3) TaxID=106370 RepID=Q2JDS0_FRACC|nr:hypothetical protein Francci3_1194 [Frankia casuarinae]
MQLARRLLVWCGSRAASSASPNTYTGTSGVPFEDALRPPNVRASDRPVGFWHLAAYPVAADRANADTEVLSHVGRRPPFEVRVRRSCGHRAIFPDGRGVAKRQRCGSVRCCRG